MNLHSLRYFYDASFYPSLTEASHHLHISQPALTKHIKNLEEDYGVKLYEKNGRHITLTPIGNELIKECHILFQQADKIECFLNQKSTHYPLKVGLTQLNSEEFIKNILINDSFDSIKIELTTGNTKKIAQLLVNELIDVAILPESDSFAHFEKEKLFSDELIFLSHPDYCENHLSKSQLSDYQFIKREAGSFIQEILNNWKQPNVTFSNQVATHAEALLLCEYKNGLYLCSSIQAKSLIDSGKFQQVVIENSPKITRDFYLYFNKQQEIKYFKRYIKQISREFQKII